MSENSLSPKALLIINNYLKLNIAGKEIQTPYFNNRRIKLRGGLRALIGKGSPEDIIEEATIVALRDKLDLKKLNGEEIKKFLVDNKLGIDCSGLVYHILNTEMKVTKNIGLNKILKRPWFKNPIRKLLVKLRPIENTGVGTFYHDTNSFEVQLKDIQPGDMIIIMGAGLKQDYNHILLVASVILRNEVTKDLSELQTNGIQKSNVTHNINSSKDSSPPHRRIGMNLTYTHSFQYPNDGQYNHGVRQETITITDINKSLLEQNWSEPQMQEYIKNAKEFKIKRLKIQV